MKTAVFKINMDKNQFIGFKTGVKTNTDVAWYLQQDRVDPGAPLLPSNLRGPEAKTKKQKTLLTDLVHQLVFTIYTLVFEPLRSQLCPVTGFKQKLLSTSADILFLVDHQQE